MRRRGFTLLDIILVLVLVGILAALAVPAMNAAFAVYEVKQAANRLRTRILEARRRAVEHGVPYAFVYVPGGTRHGFAACQSLLDAMSTGTGQSTQATPYRANPYDVHLFDFEQGFQLLKGEPTSSAGQTAQPSPDPLLQLLTPEEELLAGSGSPLVAEALRQTGLTTNTAALLLFPDGTSTGGKLTIVGPNGLAVVLTVDQLTGQVTISDTISVTREGTARGPVQPRLPQWDRSVR